MVHGHPGRTGGLARSLAAAVPSLVHALAQTHLLSMAEQTVLETIVNSSKAAILQLVQLRVLTTMYR